MCASSSLSLVVSLKRRGSSSPFLFSLPSCSLASLSTCSLNETGPSRCCPGPTDSCLDLAGCWPPRPPLLDLQLEGATRSLHPVVGREGSGSTDPPRSPN